jgi:lipopolysaccharide biosynthesis glycosyltransferase
MKTMKTLIAVNGDTPQSGQLDMFLDSLRNSKKGAYEGDVLVSSTALGNEVKESLQKYIPIFYEDSMEYLYEWDYWRDLSAYEHLKKNRIDESLIGRLFRRIYGHTYNPHAREQAEVLAARLFAWSSKLAKKRDNLLRNEFRNYYKKHFSKLNIRDYITKNQGYDMVAVFDSDIIFQSAVQPMFDLCSATQKCLINVEGEPMIPQRGSAVFYSNLCLGRHPFHRYLNYGREYHEINVGFFCAPTDHIMTIYDEWEKMMFKSTLEWLFFCHKRDFWHEQDFFRLLCNKYEEWFHIVENDLVFHAVSDNAEQLIFKNGEFYIGEEHKPAILHFAGGSWKKYEQIVSRYKNNNKGVT